MQGVDYASIDGNTQPNVAQARKAGVRFAIVRAVGVEHNKCFADPHMARDRDIWSRTDGPQRVAGAFGAYLILGFHSGDPEPEDQARAFIGTYGPRQLGELPPTIDVEFPGELGRKGTALSADGALERVERAHALLTSYYGVVMVYTSARVWTEDLDNLTSPIGAVAPLWLKTPYVYRAGNKPHPEACPAIGEIPTPWRVAPNGPGAWVQQYQGDAKNYPGFSSTVDCNAWLTQDATGEWVKRRLAYYNCSELTTFQRTHGLTPDGIIGPATFAYLTA